MNYPEVSRADLYQTLLTQGVKGAITRYGISQPLVTALRIVHRIPGWVVHPLQRQIMQTLTKHGPMRLAELVAKMPEPRPFRQSIHITCKRMVQHGYLTESQVHGVTVYHVATDTPVPSEEDLRHDHDL